MTSTGYEHEFIGDISPETTIPNGAQILIISKDQSYLTHGIHKFPAKFFPELPRYLIAKYSQKGETILDPMCGSGTVLLESLLQNRVAIGLDIDPMAQLIARVKTTPIVGSLLRSMAAELSIEISRLTKGRLDLFHIPDFPYRDKWFRPYVLKELAVILNAIEKISMGFPEVRAFFLVIFSSIIRDVSNADPHCTRTVIRKKQVRNISTGDTIARFVASLQSQVESVESLTDAFQNTECKLPSVLNASATSIPMASESVDLAVTSPPYINAVDYPRTHQLEMYWLGLINNLPLSTMKRKYIGTEAVFKREYEILHASGFRTLDPTLTAIHERDPRRSYIVYRFFEDMKRQLMETFRVLRPGGRYCIAVGNNTIRGVPVESHKILTEIAISPELGFRLDRSFFSGLIRHFIKIPRRERMHGEWVIILRKP
jgi:DNA modification methylase